MKIIFFITFIFLSTSLLAEDSYIEINKLLKEDKETEILGEKGKKIIIHTNSDSIILIEENGRAFWRGKEIIFLENVDVINYVEDGFFKIRSARGVRFTKSPNKTFYAEKVLDLDFRSSDFEFKIQYGIDFEWSDKIEAKIKLRKFHNLEIKSFEKDYLFAHFKIRRGNNTSFNINTFESKEGNDFVFEDSWGDKLYLKNYGGIIFNLYLKYAIVSSVEDGKMIFRNHPKKTKFFEGKNLTFLEIEEKEDKSILDSISFTTLKLKNDIILEKENKKDEAFLYPRSKLEKGLDVVKGKFLLKYKDQIYSLKGQLESNEETLKLLPMSKFKKNHYKYDGKGKLFLDDHGNKQINYITYGSLKTQIADKEYNIKFSEPIEIGNSSKEYSSFHFQENQLDINLKKGSAFVKLENSKINIKNQIQNDGALYIFDKGITTIISQKSPMCIGNPQKITNTLTHISQTNNKTFQLDKNGITLVDTTNHKIKRGRVNSISHTEYNIYKQNPISATMFGFALKEANDPHVKSAINGKGEVIYVEGKKVKTTDYFKKEGVEGIERAYDCLGLGQATMDNLIKAKLVKDKKKHPFRREWSFIKLYDRVKNYGFKGTIFILKAKVKDVKEDSNLYKLMKIPNIDTVICSDLYDRNKKLINKIPPGALFQNFNFDGTPHHSGIKGLGLDSIEASRSTGEVGKEDIYRYHDALFFIYPNSKPSPSLYDLDFISKAHKKKASGYIQPVLEIQNK